MDEENWINLFIPKELGEIVEEIGWTWSQSSKYLAGFFYASIMLCGIGSDENSFILRFGMKGYVVLLIGDLN